MILKTNTKLRKLELEFLRTENFSCRLRKIELGFQTRIKLSGIKIEKACLREESILQTISLAGEFFICS